MKREIDTVLIKCETLRIESKVILILASLLEDIRSKSNNEEYSCRRSRPHYHDDCVWLTHLKRRGQCFDATEYTNF